MKRFRIITLLSCAVIGAALPSCKKDDDSDDPYNKGKYVSGSLKFDMPAYVKYGDEFHLNPVGAYLPTQKPKDDGTYDDIVGYYFTNPLTDTKDTTKYCGTTSDFAHGQTDKIYSFKISKDTLGTFNLTGYAYYTGYYSASTTYRFTIVSEERSIRGVKTYPEDGVLTVEGVNYPTVTINGKAWMRKNLANSKGVPYSDCEAMTGIFGKYYTWEEAQSACPEGWTLPTAEDWQDVYALYGNKVSSILADAYFNGSEPKNRMWTLWYQVGTITDESHLSVLPCGYGMVDGEDYYFRGDMSRAVFWTPGVDGENGEFVDFYENRNEISVGSAAKTGILFNVRCKQL